MTNGNWRQQDQRPQVAFDAQYTPSPKHQGLDAKQCSVMTRHVCSLGMIIRAAVHEQVFNDTPGWVGLGDDIHSVISKCGQIYSKVRWMIVVAVYENHYLTIPLYTHNGRGLDNKCEQAKKEYVSVRDDRHRDNFDSLSRHRKLTAEMKRGSTLLSRKTVAHLTAPVTRRYGLLVEQQGNLDRDSMRRLTKLWYDQMVGPQPE